MIVAVSIVSMMLGCGAFTGAAAAYIAPVCAQMGFAKGEFTLYRTIVSLLGALLMPVFARLIRKMGVKKVMLIGLIGNALAYALYSFAGALWHFYLAAALEGIFTNGISFLTIGVLINSWFWITGARLPASPMPGQAWAARWLCPSSASSPSIWAGAGPIAAWRLLRWLCCCP